jgi:hypothetical protein
MGSWPTSVAPPRAFHPSCFQANITDLAIVDDPVKLEALDRRTALLSDGERSGWPLRLARSGGWAGHMASHASHASDDPDADAPIRDLTVAESDRPPVRRGRAILESPSGSRSTKRPGKRLEREKHREREGSG